MEGEQKQFQLSLVIYIYRVTQYDFAIIKGFGGMEATYRITMIALVSTDASLRPLNTHGNYSIKFPRSSSILISLARNRILRNPINSCN